MFGWCFAALLYCTDHLDEHYIAVVSDVKLSPHRSQEPAQIVACLLPRCYGLVMRSSALIPRHNLHIYYKFDFSLNFDRVLDRAGGG